MIRERVGNWNDDNLVSTGSPTASKKPIEPTKKRSPLAVRKACVSHVLGSPHYKANDWNAKITMPKTCMLHLDDARNDESEGSCVTKNMQGTMSDATKLHGVGCESMQVKKKQESSIVSDILADNFNSNFNGDDHNSAQKGDPHRAIGQNTLYSVEKNYVQGPLPLSRPQERSSLDSTVTEVRMQAEQGCCSHSLGELAGIRKQLLDIEGRQSSLMNLLQVIC